MLRRRLVALAPALLLGALLVAAPAAAAIRNRDLFEKSLGAAQQGLAQYGEPEDPAALRRVADIGYRVAAQSGFSDMPFSFYLIDMPEPNALALPGGQIFVTRGMLALELSDDMLAALLGHEIAHVVKRHGVRMERRATLLNVLGQAALLGVMISASDANRDRGGPRAPVDPYDPDTWERSRTGDLVQGTAAASVVVSELLLRSYSRDFEDESDEEGQRWAAAAGFDPRGAQLLMERMRERIPQSKEHGYWRTHPFFDQRIEAAAARGGYLKRQAAKPADALRQETQKTLLDWLAEAKPKPELEATVEKAALLAWPQGPDAERLRSERLHELREAELAKPELSRDYGKVIRRYREERAEVAALTPDSRWRTEVAAEQAQLEQTVAELYPKAQAVLREGVYEVPFLEAFASNYADAAERAQVALRLGDAYSRTGRETDAVVRYLEAWHAAPESAEGQRAAAGLRHLAGVLERLAALQELVNQERDAELRRLAAARLAQISGTYDELENGADYLRRFPTGAEAARVRERLDLLAQQAYSEVVLYQSVGEHRKAMQRIQEILTHAPLSPAAGRLREAAVVES